GGARDVGEHRRRVEVSALADALAAAEQLRAGRDRVAHLLLDIAHDLRHRQRADVDRLIHRIADPQRFHGSYEFIGELIVYISMNDKALRGDARLPVVDDARLHGDLHRLIEIGARHHHERVASAELEDTLLDTLRRGAGDARAGWLAA